MTKQKQAEINWKERFVTLFKMRQQQNEHQLSLTALTKYCHELYPDTLTYDRIKVLQLFLRHCKPEDKYFELWVYNYIGWLKRKISDGENFQMPRRESYGPYFIRDEKAVYRYVESNKINDWKVGYNND